MKKSSSSAKILYCSSGHTCVSHVPRGAVRAHAAPSHAHIDSLVNPLNPLCAQIHLVYKVMAYSVMAYIVMVYIVMACIVMAYSGMAYIVMAYAVTAK